MEDAMLLRIADVNRQYNQHLPSSKDSRPDKKGDRYNWKMIQEQMHEGVRQLGGRIKVEERSESAYRARLKGLLTPATVPIVDQVVITRACPTPLLTHMLTRNDER